MLRMYALTCRITTQVAIQVRQTVIQTHERTAIGAALARIRQSVAIIMA